MQYKYHIKINLAKSTTHEHADYKQSILIRPIINKSHTMKYTDDGISMQKKQTFNHLNAYKNNVFSKARQCVHQ